MSSKELDKYEYIEGNNKEQLKAITDQRLKSYEETDIKGLFSGII